MVASSEESPKNTKSHEKRAWPENSARRRPGRHSFSWDFVFFVVPSSMYGRRCRSMAPQAPGFDSAGADETADGAPGSSNLGTEDESV